MPQIYLEKGGLGCEFPHYVMLFTVGKRGLFADSVEAVVRKAIGKLFVFADEGFVAGGVTEGFIECAGKRAAFEHFFHDALGDFGEVVFHDAVDVLPEVAGSYGVRGGGRGGSGHRGC